MTPQQFFSDWLPAEAARLASSRPASGGSGELTTRIELEGSGGGAFHLAIREGSLKTAPDGPADITLRQTIEDWRAMVFGEEGAPELLPPQASSLDLLAMDASSADLVRMVQGSVSFEVTGYQGRTWRLRIHFGKQPLAAKADVTVAIDAITYDKLLSRQIAPAEAYFGGKVSLSGDINLAMQIGMALLPRFMGILLPQG